MKTKEKLLAKALALFNAEGIEQVSLRQIARALDISDGNLRYHYKTKSDLIEALYFQLVERLNQSIQAPERVDLKALFEGTRYVYELLLEYKFFMLNFVQLMRQHPKVKTHFVALQKVREQQFDGFFMLLEQASLLKPTTFPNERSHLFRRFQILGDFWISSGEILYEGDLKKMPDYYARLNLEMLFPYLTEEGKEAFFLLWNLTT